MNIIVFSTHHYHWLFANLYCIEIPAIRDLRLMPAVNPGLLPDIFDLEIKYFRIGIDCVVHPIRFYKFRYWQHEMTQISSEARMVQIPIDKYQNPF